jgi:hypothetical protein
MMKKPIMWAMPMALPMALMLQGCIARTAVNVVTLPVRAGAQGVDWATTSRDEADRNRGREIRKQEKEEARQRRKDCRRAGGRDCD